jgi:hypothetical protein
MRNCAFPYVFYELCLILRTGRTYHSVRENTASPSDKSVLMVSKEVGGNSLGRREKRSVISLYVVFQTHTNCPRACSCSWVTVRLMKLCSSHTATFRYKMLWYPSKTSCATNLATRYSQKLRQPVGLRM